MSPSDCSGLGSLQPPVLFYAYLGANQISRVTLCDDPADTVNEVVFHRIIDPTINPIIAVDVTDTFRVGLVRSWAARSFAISLSRSTANALRCSNDPRYFACPIYSLLADSIDL